MANYGKPLGNMVINLQLNDLSFKSAVEKNKKAVGYWMSEMKSSMKVMDQSGDKLGVLQAKQTGLTKVIADQEKAVKSAREALEKYQASAEQDGEKTLKLATEVRNAESKLAGFEKQLGQTNAAISRMKTELELSNSKAYSFGQSMESVGSSIQNAGSKISGFGSQVSGLGSTLTNKITKPVLAAASTLAGVTLFKGFGRLKEIDTAKAKLTALGHDATNVTDIMNSAMDSVKGTSFGLGAAATSAASAVAAGIEPGKELTRYLSITADAAAIADVEMSEMASVINKVQTNQKAYNGELQQLGDKGIPIYQWLADEIGVADDAVFDLAKDGQINSEIFLNAIESNIGGAAKTMGDLSFSASLANIWASVGRIGANFLDAGGKGGGFFSQLKPLMGEMLENMDSLEDKAAELGVKFGEMFTNFIEKARKAVDTYKSLDGSQKDLIKGVGIFLVTIGPVLKIVGPIVTIFGKFTSVIGTLVSGIGGLISSVTSFVVSAGGIGSAFASIGTTIMGFLTGPVVLITAAIAALVAAFIYAYENIQPFKECIDGLIASFIVFATELYQNYIKPAIYEIVSSFQKAFESIKQFWDENGAQIVEGLYNFFVIVMSIIQPALTVVWELIKSVMRTITELIKVAWDTIKGIFSGAFQIIQGLIQVFVGIFTGDIDKVCEGVTNIFKGMFKVVTSAFEGFFSGIGKLANGIGDLITSAIGGAINGVIKGINWVLDLLGLDPIKEFSFTKTVVSTQPPTGGFQAIGYAKGTDGHPGGHAVVNDQKGPLFKELIQYPSGKTFIPNGRNVLIPNMPRGTRVLNARDTKSIVPHYEGGIGDWLGSSWGKVKDWTGNVWDYMSDPSKLLEIAMDKFASVSTSVEPWFDMGLGSIKYLSSSASEFIKDKMEELFSSNTNGDGPYAPNFTNPPFTLTSSMGARWGTTHNGIDFGAPIGTPIPAVNGGTVVNAGGGVSGFGNWVVIEVAKGIQAIYGHISKWLVNTGQTVTKGQKIAEVGNEGQSTGPHLHYELRHNGVAVDPYTFGAGEATGTGVERWRSTVIQALKLTGQYTADNVTKTLYQMQTESNGDPKAINNWDSNALAGTPSKGLMQVIDPTFRAYAMSGFNSNIYDPLSNIIASIRYAVSRYGTLSNAYRGTGYENGGIITREHLAMVGEGNKPEMVIPLTRKARAVELMNRAKEMMGIYDDSTTLINDNTKLEHTVEKLSAIVEEQGTMMLQLLNIIANKSTTLDGKIVEESVTQRQTNIYSKLAYGKGI